MLPGPCDRAVRTALMRVLLTGGTGFLGRAVAAALKAAGHDLVLMVRPGKRRDEGTGQVDVVEGDVTSPASLRAAMGGPAPPEAVVHLAAMVQMWRPEAAEFDRVNVGGLQNVLDAAWQAGVRRLVYGSSFMALGPSRGRPLNEEDDPRRDRFNNDYERTKYLADQLARRRTAAGEPLVVVYPGVVYGPGLLTAGGLVTRQIREFLKGRLPGILGPGDQPVCYAFIEDVARGAVLALERGKAGRGYILGGVNATLNELMETLARVSGRKAPTRHIPYGLASLLGRLQWWRARLTGHPPELTHQVVNIYRQSWAYDCSRACQELGYQVTSLEEGLRKTVRWLEAGRFAA
ncbi:MAG: NAD-dependent epimerase/dehydratase family protein [Acidobacteriota bacterium]